MGRGKNGIGAQPSVRVACRKVRGATDPRAVKRLAARVLRAAGCDRAELSVLLCDDACMRELNRAYRGLDRPTDVLSFSMAEGCAVGAGHPGPRLLGDVVISVETAARRAARRGEATMDELRALLVHGVLHLLGHDHAEPGEATRMRRAARGIERMLTSRPAPHS
jgi:probable rRNA maturation factor